MHVAGNCGCIVPHPYGLPPSSSCASVATVEQRLLTQLPVSVPINMALTLADTNCVCTWMLRPEASYSLPRAMEVMRCCLQLFEDVTQHTCWSFRAALQHGFCGLTLGH